MMKSTNHIIALVLAVCILSAPSGCHHGRPLRAPEPENLMQQRRSVAIVPFRNPPKIVNELYVRDVMKSIADPILVGVTALLVILSIPLGGAGSVYQPRPKKKVPQEQVDIALAPVIKSLSDQGLALIDTNTLMTRQVASTAAVKKNITVTAPRNTNLWPPIGHLNRKSPELLGADAVVFIKMDEVGFSGTTPGKDARNTEGATFLKIDDDPKFSFNMSGVAVMIRISDGKELSREWLSYRSKAQRISEWTQNPTEVRQEIENAYRIESQKIVENLLEYANYPEGLAINNIAKGGDYCMMAPREPYACNKNGKSKITECVQSQYTIVHTLTPTLKWEAFPRSQDRDMWVDRELEKISDVNYDLKVVSGSFPWSVVYERTGLKSTSELGSLSLKKEDTATHTIEVPLEADSLYLWTVRARYKYSSMEQITEWSYFIFPGESAGCNNMTIHSPARYYPFRTPKVAGGN